MAEYSEARNAILRLASNRDTAQSAEVWETKDIANTYYKLLTLIEKEERGIASGADRRAIAAGKETLGYYKANKAYDTAMANVQSRDYATKVNSYTKILNQRIASDTKYNLKVNSADADLSQETARALRELRGGADPVLAVFELIKPKEIVPGYGKKSKISTDDPQYRETIRNMMDQINDKNGVPIFVFTTSKDGRPTSELDMEATQNRLSDPKGRTNLSRKSAEFQSVVDVLGYYQAANERHAAHEQHASEDLAESQGMLDAALAAGREGNTDEAGRILQQYQDHEIARAGTFQLRHNMQPAGELRADLNNRVAEAQMRKETHARATQYATFLEGKLYGSSGDAEQLGIAKGIANPNFRAWAADYGWDALGQVAVDEDGNPDYSQYRPGGDDIAALVAWDKQSSRTPGNYGLKRIDSGEVLRVEMLDGSVVTGARLRRHAADPMGSIRMVTAEGARVIQPNEVSQAIYLKRPKADITRIDSRAMKMYDRDKGKYDRLTRAAMDRGDDMVRADLVQGEDGQYLKSTETGKYVTKDALEQAKKDRLNTTGYHYIQTADENGVVTAMWMAAPDGRVFSIDRNNVSLTELDKAAASKVLSGSSPGTQKEFGSTEAEETARSDASVAPVPLVAQNPMEREYMFVLNEDGSMRPFTDEDFAGAIKAGKLDAGEGAGSVQIPSHVKIPAHAEALGVANAAMTSKAALGMVDVADPPSDLEGVSLTGGDGATGIWITSMGEGDDYELPDDATLERELNQIELAQQDEIDRTIGEPDRLADRSVTMVGGTDEMRPDDSPNPLGALPSTAGRELSDEQEMASYLAQKDAAAAAATAATPPSQPGVGKEPGPASTAGKSANDRGVWDFNSGEGSLGTGSEAIKAKELSENAEPGFVAKLLSSLTNRRKPEAETPEGTPAEGTDLPTDAKLPSTQIPGVGGVVGDKTPKETAEERAAREKKNQKPTVGQDMGKMGLNPSDFGG